MGLGRPIPKLRLTENERETLERWTRRATTAQGLARRAQIVLACAEGKTNTAVAADLRLAKPTVGKWRARFLQRGGDGLLDEANTIRCGGQAELAREGEGAAPGGGGDSRGVAPVI